jgi:hypothetical protein
MKVTSGSAWPTGRHPADDEASARPHKVGVGFRQWLAEQSGDGALTHTVGPGGEHQHRAVTACGAEDDRLDDLANGAPHHFGGGARTLQQVTEPLPVSH